METVLQMAQLVVWHDMADWRAVMCVNLLLTFVPRFKHINSEASIDNNGV